MIKFFCPHIPHNIPSSDNNNEEKKAKYKTIKILKIFRGTIKIIAKVTDKPTSKPSRNST